MIKSKFKFRAFLIPVLIVAFTSVCAFIILSNWPITDLKWIEIYMGVMFSFSWIWLVFGELRTKVIQVMIESNHIEKKNYLGLNQCYNFKDFDGFQTSILTSKGESFEYLYLIKDKQKIVKISEAYHQNYDELKDKIEANFHNFGEIKFSFIDEFKEIFK